MPRHLPTGRRLSPFPQAYQTDAPDEYLPEGDERSEQFAAKVGEFFVLKCVRIALSTCHQRCNTIPGN